MLRVVCVRAGPPGTRFHGLRHDGLHQGHLQRPQRRALHLAGGQRALAAHRGRAQQVRARHQQHEVCRKCHETFFLLLRCGG